MNATWIGNRGFNLMAAAVLGFGGLTFGSVLLQEADLPDKVDDGGFLIIAAAMIVWYVWRTNRFTRSPIPLVAAIAAVLVQILGLVIERDDPRAFGDNIGGGVYFGSTLLLLVVQYRRTKILIGLARQDMASNKPAERITNTGGPGQEEPRR